MKNIAMATVYAFNVFSMTGKQFKIARALDSRTMANLGCSGRVCAGWTNIDFSLLVRLGRYRLFCKALYRFGILDKARYERMYKLAGEIIVWDLRNGIPFPDKAFDVVYHSHLLEHIDRETAPDFLKECYRVLKPGGRLRIVVPDFELLSRRYIELISKIDSGEKVLVGNAKQLESAVAAMIDQMVTRVPRDRAERPALIRLLEHLFVGDTANNGAMHRWMYDRYSLRSILEQAGYIEVSGYSANESAIANWNSFGLDLEPDGRAYKADSLYMEATRHLSR